MRLFHYHLVTSEIINVEARYVGKLGFHLVARYGRVDDEHVSVEAGVPWDSLERRGFKLRLTELERGAVNIVVQPGHWRLPRIDHLGVALDEDEYESVLGRAMHANLRVTEHGGRRTFVATNAGYRLEIHPPREWIEQLLGASSDLQLARAAAPHRRCVREGRGARAACSAPRPTRARSTSAAPSSGSSKAGPRDARSCTRSAFS